MALSYYIGYLIDRGRKVDVIYKQWTDSDNKSEFIEKYLKEEIKETPPSKDIENTVY